MQSSRLMGHFLVLMTVIVWGATYVSSKILLQDFTPLELLVFRFCIGFICLWMMYPKRLKFESRQQEGYFALAGLLGVTLYFLLENIALLYTTASNVGVISSLAPLLTVICNVVFLKGSRPTGFFVFGLIISMIGIACISLQKNEHLAFNLWGDFLAFMAIVVWALYSTVMKKVSLWGHNMVAVTRRTFGYGLIFMLFITPFADFTVDFALITAPHNLLNLLFLGAIASAVGFFSWNYSVKILGTVTTSLYIYLIPVVTVITAIYFLNERLTWLSVLGIALTLCGLFVSERGKRLAK